MPKIMEIYRGKSSVNHKCTNGDVYDSSATLIDPVAVGPREIWHSELVNTDHTIGYKGGILAEGEYYGIVGLSSKGKRVIKLFLATEKQLAKILTHEDLTAKMMTLPSNVPNPNHGGERWLRYVYIHEGYLTEDGSHGCLTVYRYPIAPAKTSDYQMLMDVLQDNEIIKVKLL